MAPNSEENFRGIVNSLKEFKEIDAAALGGSRSAGNCDENSDYDLYVYCLTEVKIELRQKALAPFCAKAEFGNAYWESEDNCVMKCGAEIDIIYRDLENIAERLDTVVNKGFAMNGYTTCIWRNVITSEILFDKSGNFTALQKKYGASYPKALKRNIIKKNRNLLSGALPSFDKQIKKAAARGDAVSVHHRTTEFLASYFDIIFAMNETPHPGEKRLVESSKKLCKILPDKFEENINALLESVPNGDTYGATLEITRELDKALARLP